MFYIADVVIAALFGFAIGAITTMIILAIVILKRARKKIATLNSTHKRSINGQ